MTDDVSNSLEDWFMSLCACGCGKPLARWRGHYLPWHARRAGLPKFRTGERQICRCGCGTMTRWGAYVRGHNPKPKGEASPRHRNYVAPVLGLLVLFAGCGGSVSAPVPPAVVPLVEPVRPSTEIHPLGTCIPHRWACFD